jgi:peroxiredoxin Q/BCP
MAIDVGDPFPDFEGETYDGERIRLGDLFGAGLTVVYFYPRDLTPGCTREANDFNARLAQFAAVGARVVGISVDGPAAHRRFAERYALTFPLLTDRGGALAERLGIRKETGTARRTTFVVGRDGRVRHIFHVRNVNGHVDEVLAAVRALAG